MVQSIMEDLATETATGSSSVHEAERRMGILEPSIGLILLGLLDLYPCKIQELHQLLLADTGAKQNFATWAPAQMERNP